MFVKETIPARMLTYFSFPIVIQVRPFGMILRKEKCSSVSTYKPPSQSKQYFFDWLSDFGIFTQIIMIIK